MKTYNKIYTVHAWKDNNKYFTVTQGEGGIKYPRLKVVDDNGAIDLTGSSITYTATLPRGSEEIVDVSIINATEGTVEFEIKSSMTKYSGIANGELNITIDNKVLKISGINLAISSATNGHEIESSEQFSALVEALRKVVTVTPEGTAVIPNGNITTEKLADNAITSNKIANDAITASKLSLELLTLINSVANKADTADVDTALAAKADKATTLDGYGITDAYTKTTVKSLLAGKLDAMSFDNEPTFNSPCYLTSGTVYSALTKKFDNSNIETGKGNLAPAQAIYDGYEGSFNYSKIGKIVTVALNITTLIAGKNYVQFSGLPYTALTASRLSSFVVYTTANKLVNLRLDGSWLYISSPDTTFADGEKINAIITYIIG